MRPDSASIGLSGGTSSTRDRGSCKYKAPAAGLLRPYLDQGGNVLIDQLVEGVEQRVVLLPVAGGLGGGVSALRGVTGQPKLLHTHLSATDSWKPCHLTDASSS